MSSRDLAALILGSALITLDGTAATVALPAIGRDLDASFSQLQWIGNAPLLMLAALLLPAGVLGDRYGRPRLVRLGLLVFAMAALGAAAASSPAGLIAARLLEGAGGALVLPGAVASLRAAYTDPLERTRKFGVWAAWTGVAGVTGPLLGGALVDVLSWRGIFAVSAAAGLVGAVLLRGVAHHTRPAAREPLPLAATVALVALLGSIAYLLIEGATAEWTSPRTLLAGGILVPGAVAVLARSPSRRALVPPELLTTANCVPANGATFALYFGVFGLSFLLVLYTQQALGYSGMWAGAGVLPVSLMLLFAERFGRLANRIGTRILTGAGSLTAAAGILWIAAGPEPLSFWSRIVAGAAVFGLGISLTVSALTHAAVSAVPESCAGAASGFNHATVRAAGLVAIALLGSLAAGTQSGGMSAEGFRRAMVVCGAIVAAGGVVSAAFLRDEEPGGLRNAA